MLLYASQMSTTTNERTKLLTDLFHGQRGPVYEAWKKPFLDAAATKGDDDASYDECYLGTDPRRSVSLPLEFGVGL